MDKEFNSTFEYVELELPSGNRVLIVADNVINNHIEKDMLIIKSSEVLNLHCLGSIKRTSDSNKAMYKLSTLM